MSGRAESARWASVDIARALALAGMFAYHLGWDLAYFGFAAPSLPFTPAMRTLSHGVAGMFLALTGVSMALAHRPAVNWPAFLGRLARIGGAAALISLATCFATPQTPIFFGILHCIAASALVCALFMRAPPTAALVVGAAAIAAPFAIQSPGLNAPALIWLGLGDAPPATLDWRPLLPWAGVALIGLGAMRLALAHVSFPNLGTPPGAPARALAFAGRHSLAIYLVHQPVMLGLLFVIAQVSGLTEMRERDAYLSACRPACVEAGGEIDACARACACVAAKAGSAGLLSGLTSRAVSSSDKSRLMEMAQACGSE